MKTQKRIAAQAMKTSPKKVVFDNQRLADIKEAITKADIRGLVSQGAITKKPVVGPARAKAKKIKIQKSKGLRKGKGSRQGKKTARLPRKEAWMIKIRNQRDFIKDLKQKELLTNETYRDLYLKSKGGFFRSKRHIKIYLEDKKLFVSKEK
jgi:large subunit ribosomal protein L19e